MSKRAATDKVSIAEIPAIFQALGYFPSEFEIQNILNEIKYAKVLDSAEIAEQVTIEEVIKQVNSFNILN